MPTVLNVRSYRFFFVSSDRSEPPHIHVRREDMVAKFWLEPVVLERGGGFSRARTQSDWQARGGVSRAIDRELA